MKPTIYLGLGGTGNLAVSYAKRLYEKEYGEGNIPAPIAFVTVDFQSDMDSNTGLVSDISENFITAHSETNPKTYYSERHEQYGEFAWMFSCNTGNIDKKISKGAKQVRTTGRLYAEMTMRGIMDQLNAIYTRVTSVHDGADEAHNGVNIHMVMSLAGGTGAGSFITLADAIKQRWTNVNLYGYGLTGSIFRNQLGFNQTPNVELNTISSIIDLDFLFSLESSGRVVQIERNGTKHELKESVFDNFYVVEDKSEKGHSVGKITNICEVIGTCLYALGGTAGDSVEAVNNNVGYKEGQHNVLQKIGWVQGLGACQIVYKGEELAKIYANKASVELIRKICQEGTDISADVLNWMLEPDVALREDGAEFDMLTDTIYAPTAIASLKLPSLSAEDTDAANQSKIDSYLVKLVNFPDDEWVRKLVAAKKELLDAKLAQYLSVENGVGNAVKFLQKLLESCEGYKVEMESEISDYSNKREEKYLIFTDKAYKTYLDEKLGSWRIKAKETNQELLDDYVARPAKELLVLSHEIRRREVARDVYAALIAIVKAKLNHLTTISSQLQKYAEACSDDVEKMQSVKADALIFEIDLSYAERVSMSVKSEEIIVGDFVKTLGAESLLTMDIDMLLSRIKDYTTQLPRANEYRNKVLTEIIDNLPTEDYKKLKDEVARKSARWLVVDSRSQCILQGGERVAVEDAIVKNWIIVGYKPNEGYKPRLQKDVNFLSRNGGLEPQFALTDKESIKQRMILCRVDGSVIPYCIASIDEAAMRRYTLMLNQSRTGSATFNPHIDKIWLDTMMEDDFKLKPEMKNEAIFYWVCGHLFGWKTVVEDERIMVKDENGKVLKKQEKQKVEHIKYIYNLNGKYVYWNPQSLPGANDQWTPLDNVTRRDSAFSYFKSNVLPTFKEDFKHIIKEQYGAKRAWWKDEINRIIQDGFANYIDRIVCANKQSTTYFTDNGGELKLLQEEFKYLTDLLLNQLENLK